MKRAALLSVSDKTGLDELVRDLADAGYIILASSGTGRYIEALGLDVLSVAEYTGQKEILDGRVKTLHPKIHAGLLAKRDNPSHLKELEENGILPIDIAVVNLYPFIEGSESERSHSEMIELIDIGGPAMIRAAAKNYHHVIPLIDPGDYEKIRPLIKTGEVPESLRCELARRVFASLALYNLEIAKYFGRLDDNPKQGDGDGLGLIAGEVLERRLSLRYGENPHQKASYYAPLGSGPGIWKQLHGKELSYNNFLDFNACFRMIRGLASQPAVVIVKHLNPCGAAVGEDPVENIKRARQGDPRSHFGGIVGCSRIVTAAAAKEIRKGFVEIVLAPAFEPDALQILKTSKNLRVLEVDLERVLERYEVRSIASGYLIQECDPGASPVANGRVVSKRQPTVNELRDLEFALTICSFVKSNAVVAAKDQMLLSAGVGQMSRVDSSELLVSKAKLHGNSLKGAVAASDAFFPFPDAFEILVNEGVSAVAAPGGAKRDEEVIAAADKLGASLIFTEERHFKH